MSEKKKSDGIWLTKRKAAKGLIHDLKQVIKIVREAGEGNDEAVEWLNDYLVDTKTWQLKGIGESNEVRMVVDGIAGEYSESLFVPSKADKRRRKKIKEQLDDHVC